MGSPSVNNGVYDSNWYRTITASILYARERANTNGKVCSSGSDCNDSVTRTSTWTGRVALIYQSDYVYATGGGSNTNRQSCLNTPIYNWRTNQLNLPDCNNNNWLKSYWERTLTPLATSSEAIYVLTITEYGALNNLSAAGAIDVSPVVFLKSNTIITNGSGTQSDPYVVALP